MVTVNTNKTTRQFIKVIFKMVTTMVKASSSKMMAINIQVSLVKDERSTANINLRQGILWQPLGINNLMA